MTTKKIEDGQGRLVDLYLGENYNPDVISCLANLSNDEVFTPPDIVNRMLDMLPQELFEDPDVTFLDPFCKSGVFLREIAKRLIRGLEKKIPDLHERIENIFMRQLFGIAITELTSLLARRTLYCSKYADSKYSIVPFESSDGNIRFKNISHKWVDGKCVYCGVSESSYGEEVRGIMKESHAYEFIHTDNPEELFDMKFDVIIGNPPYQMNVGVQKDNYAIPIFQKFIEKAKALNPAFLTMIIPARWYAGGRNLDDFRKEMLHDNHITRIIDYPNAADCFPGIDLSGGVCIFLREKNRESECIVSTFTNGTVSSEMERPLLEKKCEAFIRFNEAISIVRKIQEKNEATFDSLVSPQTPFGFVSSFKDYEQEPFDDCVKIHTVNGIGYIRKDQIKKGNNLVSDYKVYISKSYGERGSYPYLFLGKPFLGEKNSCCTQTYLCIGCFKSMKEAKNVIKYIHTRFFRFCIMLKKNTQDAMRGVYSFVPIQDFSKIWTDDELYSKYGLSQEEISFIESMVRPMEL